MAEGGGLPSLVLRMTLLLLLLGVASLQLQAWMSRRAIKERNATATARIARNVKHESVVVGEAAGRRVPGRVQCRDGLLKNDSIGDMEVDERRSVRHRPCLDSEKETVSFVTLFVVPEAVSAGSEFSEQMKVKKRTRIKEMETNTLYAVLRIFLESVEDFLEVMIEKRKNSSATPIIHVIFSDFDMIVVDDMGCVFEDHLSFDVALTFRNNRRQPINSGIIMVRGTLESLTRGKLLLKEVVEVYRAKFSHEFDMLGDQLALADLVKGTIQAARTSQGVPFEARVMAAKTLFLPCSTYNWTPSEGAGQFHGMPTDVKVLHFKGSRKRLMIQAWNLYKQQGAEDFFNMKCLVLRSGRSKYDF